MFSFDNVIEDNSYLLGHTISGNGNVFRQLPKNGLFKQIILFMTILQNSEIII